MRSKYRGVTWRKKSGLWRAKIQIDGKVHYIGEFKTELEAALAYDEFAREKLGDKAKLNFNMSFFDILGELPE